MIDQTPCEKVKLQLDDYVDGNLGDVEKTRVDRHIARCVACRGELDGLRRVVAAAKELPRSIDPEVDLWPGIESRLRSQRVVAPPSGAAAVAGRRRWWSMAAAAVVLAVSVTLAYVAGVEHAATKSASAPTVGSDVIPAAWVAMASDLEQARDQLRASVERRRDELSRETWSVVMDNMAVIDDAINRIEEALAENPGDERLNRQLTGAYRRQITLLQRAATLPAEV